MKVETVCLNDPMGAYKSQGHKTQMMIPEELKPPRKDVTDFDFIT